MIDSKWRKPYQTLVVDPLIRQPLFSKLSPHALTALGLILGILSAFFIAMGTQIPALCFLALSGFFDTLDGSLARYQNRSSPKGAVFDIFSDRVVEWAIIMGLYFVCPQDRALCSVIMLGSILLCITSFLVVAIFTQNNSTKSFNYSPGIMERTEAFLFFGAMILWSQHFTLLASVFSLLVLWTGCYRTFIFLKDYV